MAAKKSAQKRIEPKKPQTESPATVQQELESKMPAPDIIEYDGEKYRVTYAAVNDIEVMEAFQRSSAFFPPELNGALTALQKSLGPDYEKFKADQTRKHGSCRATAIFEMFALIDSRAGGN